MSEEEEILGAFLLVNDYRILTNEELENVKKAIKNLQQENTQLKKQLKETNNCLNLQISNVTLLEKELKDKDEKISKVKEYITSYESISTIQSLEFSKDNDSLDEKTMTEMCRRYLIVHDTILEILESE